MGLREVARDRVLGPLCSVNFLFTFGVAQLETIFAYWMIDRFDYDARSVAWILVLMALVMASIQGGGMRALAARFGERTLLLTGLVAMAVAFPVAPAMGTVALLLVPLLVSAIGPRDRPAAHDLARVDARGPGEPRPGDGRVPVGRVARAGGRAG